MLSFTDAQLKSILKEKYPDSTEVVDNFQFGPFPDLEESVKSDVQLLKEHPLILKDIAVTGWIYETETGKVGPSYFISTAYTENMLVRYRLGV